MYFRPGWVDHTILNSPPEKRVICSALGGGVEVIVTVKLLVSLRAGEPLSVTRTVIVFVPGPCASVGVQVKMPVAGSITASEGAPASSEKVIVCAGRSASEAAQLMVSWVPSAMV